MEIHQKKAGPDYHRLKTMVKRSIEQNLRMKNFEARNGNYETNAVVKNQGTKQRGQRALGECWQWKASGQCSEGDNCSFRHDISCRVRPSHTIEKMGNAKIQCWNKTHKKMKWRLAMRIATSDQNTGPTERLEDQRRDGKMTSTNSSNWLKKRQKILQRVAAKSTKH